jgi:hypothetical protein
MSVMVQQPVNATSMTIRPDIGRGRQGPDGLIIYTAMIGEVEAGRTFSYQIEYEKPDDELVTPPMTVQPVEPIDAQTAGRTTMMEVIPWVLGSLGVLLIAVPAHSGTGGRVAISQNRRASDTLPDGQKKNQCRPVKIRSTVTSAVNAPAQTICSAVHAAQNSKSTEVNLTVRNNKNRCGANGLCTRSILAGAIFAITGLF